MFSRVPGNHPLGLTEHSNGTQECKHLKHDHNGWPEPGKPGIFIPVLGPRVGHLKISSDAWHSEACHLIDLTERMWGSQGEDESSSGEGSGTGHWSGCAEAKGVEDSDSDRGL